MEEEKVPRAQKDLHRWRWMEMVKVGKIILKEAAEKTGVFYWQVKRIRRAIREQGIKGLLHGNRGRPSDRRSGESLRQPVPKFLINNRPMRIIFPVYSATGSTRPFLQSLVLSHSIASSFLYATLRTREKMLCNHRRMLRYSRTVPQTRRTVPQTRLSHHPVLHPCFGLVESSGGMGHNPRC